MHVHVRGEHLALMRRELEEAAPGEACGVLVGRSARDHWVVDEVIPTTNIRPEIDRFEVNPQELLRVWADSERNKKEIVGFYHTHPHSGPQPSEWDAEGMKHNPLVWLIISREEEGAYIWKNEIGVQQITIREGKEGV